MGGWVGGWVGGHLFLIKDFVTIFKVCGFGQIYTDFTMETTIFLNFNKTSRVGIRQHI